jgi:DNA-binding XRE family transcriptional regulator
VADINKNLHIRTDDEHLWLARRVRGLTQEEMAHNCKVPYKTYFRCEKGQATWPKALPPLTKVQPGDLCALARRRHGLTLLKTAVTVGCSHATLLAREQASDPDLVTSWRQLGYVF